MDTTADAKKAPEAAQTEVLQQLKAVVTIESVDLPMQMIVYKGGDNRRVQRQVSDPRLLDGLKAGDVIEITYTRARAIELQRRPDFAPTVQVACPTSPTRWIVASQGSVSS